MAKWQNDQNDQNGKMIKMIKMIKMAKWQNDQIKGKPNGVYDLII